MISRAQFDIEGARSQHAVLSQAEAAIDSALRKVMAAGGNSASIAVGVLGGIPYPLISVLLDRYRQAGWKAEYISDQRDGDYVVLK